METKYIIQALLDNFRLSPTEFASKIGTKTSQAVYDLLAGRTVSLSKSMQDKILSCYPEINRVWLLTGDGEMLRPSVGDVSQTAGDDSVQVAGVGGDVVKPTAGVPSSIVDKLLAELAAQRVAKDEQIAELLSQNSLLLSSLLARETANN